AELVLRLAQPARRQGRALRVERVALALRERIELARAFERDRRDALLLPHLPHILRLPDEIGHAVDDRHQVDPLHLFPVANEPLPGSSPRATRSASGRTSGGGTGSASASAEAQTSPPCSSSSSARARSPTRCGGGARPEPQRSPREGRKATRSSPMNHDSASA